MAKRENLNPAAGLFNSEPVVMNNNTHVVQEVRKAQQVQEVVKSKDNLKNTQGRKGHKLPRINMAFTPENHEFIKRTSRQQGISATEFVNNLIDAARCHNFE